MRVAFSTMLAGLVVGIPSFLLGWLGYRRGLKVDKSAAKQAVEAARGTEVSQVIDGLNQLVDQLQTDNQIWRDSLQSVSLKLTECVQAREEMRQQINDLLR